MSGVSTGLKREIKIGAVVTRANGSVEDWGRIGGFETGAQKVLYAIAHPVLMVKRCFWHLREMRRQRADALAKED